MYKSSFIYFVHAETESQARASLGKPLVHHLRYAFQILEKRSQYLNPGNYRAFSLFQGSIITPAHSDESYMQNYGKFMETRFNEPEHESKMRLLKTHSHTSE